MHSLIDSIVWSKQKPFGRLRLYNSNKIDNTKPWNYKWNFVDFVILTLSLTLIRIRTVSRNNTFKIFVNRMFIWKRLSWNIFIVLIFYSLYFVYQRRVYLWRLVRETGAFCSVGVARVDTNPLFFIVLWKTIYSFVIPSTNDC